MTKLIADINSEMITLESSINTLENELLCDAAFESVLFGESDIALEANIIQKIKSGIAKLKSGKKNEGKKDLDEAVDELKEAEKEAEESGDEEKKKKLSKAAKIGIGIGAAAILAAAGIAAKKGLDKRAHALKRAAVDSKNVADPDSDDLLEQLQRMRKIMQDPNVSPDHDVTMVRRNGDVLIGNIKNETIEYRTKKEPGKKISVKDFQTMKNHLREMHSLTVKIKNMEQELKSLQNTSKDSARAKELGKEISKMQGMVNNHAFVIKNQFKNKYDAKVYNRALSKITKILTHDKTIS